MNVSIGAWIDRQPWSDDKRTVAHHVHDQRAAKQRHPMTGSAWRSWSDKFDANVAAVARSAISLDAVTTQDRRDKFAALTYRDADEAFAGIGTVFAATGGYDDSVDREAMFSAAAIKIGVPYDDLYYRWLNSDDSWGMP